MILMIEKCITEGMCQSTHRYTKANNKYMKIYDKEIEIIQIQIINIFRFKQFNGWEVSQKLPVNGFMLYNDHLSDFNEEFKKNYNENGDEGFFLQVDSEYPKQLWGSHKDLPFMPERRKLEKQKNLTVVQKTKKNISYT